MYGANTLLAIVVKRYPMSLSVDISKDFGGFKLDLAFEAGNETLGFWELPDAESLSPCVQSPGSKRPMRGKLS